MQRTDLAGHVLNEFRGELVSTVGEYLMRQGSCTLKEIEHATKVNRAKVKKALLILIQHGMVDYQQNKQGMIEYKIYVERVIHQIYYHKEVECVGLLYGDAAEMMIEELQQEGRLPLHTLVESVTNKLNEAIKAQGGDLKEVQPSYVQDKFERLVATHFIKRCCVTVKNDRGRVVALKPPPAKMMFLVPPRATAGNTVKVKQEPTEACSAAKKPRLSLDASQQDSSSEPETVYWEINHQRFLHHFRDQALASAVGSALDSEKAAEIMRTILRQCEKTTDQNAPSTLPVSFNEIYAQLPKDKAMSRHTLEQWLKLMTDSMPEFISKAGESGGGMYIINTFQALQSLCTAHIESVVEERLGSKARRILQVILQKKYLEQDTIERSVLMPAKQSRELIFRMFKEHFIHISELSKTPDHAAARTFFLLSVPVEQIARFLLSNSYLTLKNLLLSRQLMLSDAKRVLEKQERVETIIVSLDLPASLAYGEEADREGMEVDEEKREQMNAILETITPAERQQLKKVKALTRQFQVVEENLVGSTIFILESFMAMTYSPPPPKPVKNLLD